MFFGDHEHRLLLAHAIGEWTTAIEHVKAIVSTGVIHPYPHGLMARLGGEHSDLLNQWASIVGRPASDEADLLASAREYATKHAAEIDSLLEEKGAT